MGSETQLSQSLSSTGEISDNLDGATIVQLPSREVWDQIAQTKSASAILRQSLVTMQQHLERLEGVVEEIEDIQTRQKFQDQMSAIHESLLLRLDQLSSIDHSLQVALSSDMRRGCAQLLTSQPSGGCSVSGSSVVDFVGSDGACA